MGHAPPDVAFNVQPIGLRLGSPDRLQTRSERIPASKWSGPPPPVIVPCAAAATEEVRPVIVWIVGARMIGCDDRCLTGEHLFKPIVDHPRHSHEPHRVTARQAVR